MLLVGLIEGSVYVFGYYLMYEDKNIEENLRELSINISFNCSDIFLILSSLICLILDNTLLSV